MGAKTSGGGRPVPGPAVENAGFTLIEILVVVTIIIMVFGFAMPTIAAFMSNQKLKAVTGRLSRSLAIARTRAITKHQEVYVIFFSDRLMLLSSRLEVPELFDYFASRKEAGKMVIHLRFADAYVKETGNEEHELGLTSDLPALPAGENWNEPITAKTVLQSGLLDGKEAYLAFRSDGTVEFGHGTGPGDRLSIEYWSDPPRDADFIVEEQGNALKGWVDVRATGNVDTRLEKGDPKTILTTEEEE
jgi:prepilin-type N-terminal cleavage/methylation domain-containing protein